MANKWTALAPAQDDVDVDGDGHVMLMMATAIVRMMLMLIAEDDECTNNGRSDDDDNLLATLPQTLCTMPISLHTAAHCTTSICSVHRYNGVRRCPLCDTHRDSG